MLTFFGVLVETFPTRIKVTERVTKLQKKRERKKNKDETVIFFLPMS